MDAVVVEQKNKKDWDQFVQESPFVIAWHGYDWSKVVSKHYGTDFYPLAVYDGAKICGILPLYRVRTFRSGQALISVPYFVAGGIAAEDKDVQDALLNRAVEISRELNIAHITFKQYKLRLKGALKTDDNYYNRELELSSDVDQVWRSISETNRAKVQEADKYDLRLEYPSPDVSTFYRFLLCDQHAAGVPCVSKSWVEDLFSTGAYEIAFLRYKGNLVAATMVKKFRDTVSFPFSCLRDQSEETQLCAYSLYWQLITRLAKEGIRICHSGRIPNTDQAFGYRLGWGGTKYTYYYQYYGAGEGKTEFSVKRGRKRELIASVWKKIPVSVARILGPTVVREFP
jgi:serine/alanine adding enzyme